MTGQKVHIKGTAEEIKKAKELIQLKLEEDGHGNSYSQQNIPARLNLLPTFDVSNVETLKWGSDFVEVFVSALKSPRGFHVQVGHNHIYFFYKSAF